ncbi:MAG: hypothetical protein KatS3mg065_0247 [Chloroflexota bacterium]|nr:MAG: hypothetical protein KatS3mg065_0247 [Chloroflexota bacterium]
MGIDRHRSRRGSRGVVTAEPPRALVDFNDLHGGRLIVSLADLTGMLPGPGDPIVLTDDDGNLCIGRVDETEEAYLLVRPLWETWRSTSPKLTSAWAETERPSVLILAGDAAGTQPAGEVRTRVRDWSSRWAS